MTGPSGPPGATGQPGAAGKVGFGVLAYRSGNDVLANGSAEDLEADCPPGTFATGGDAGAFDDTTGDNVGNPVIQNQFMVASDGYTAHFDNQLPSGNDAEVFVDVVCANASSLDFPTARHRTR